MITGQDDIDLALRKSQVFAAFSDLARRRLVATASTLGLEQGELLCQQGDPADSAWLVLQGEVEVRLVASDGRQVRIAVLGAGDLVGELSVLDGEARSADVVATRRTRVLRLSRPAFVEAIQTEPDAALSLIRTLSMRLRATDKALATVQTKDLGGRLSGLLLAEAGEGAQVAISQPELARRLGASREKVNRKLGQWRAAGLVEITRAGVRLLRKATLARLAGLEAGLEEGAE